MSEPASRAAPAAEGPPNREAPDTMPLGAALRWHAERAPDRPALTMGSLSYTRQELERLTNRLARDFAAHGIVAGDRAVVALPNGPDHQIACFALWKLGATVIPLSPHAVDSELYHLIEVADPKLVVGLDPARLPGRIALTADHAPDPSLDDSPLPDVVARPWKASTSGGSTGMPKLIVEDRPSTINPSDPMPMLRMKVDDVILHPAPAYHNSPFCQTNWGLAWGAHVVLMPRFDPTEWLRLVEQHHVRWAYMVPTMMSRVLALPKEVRESFDVSSLEVIMHMAAPCPEWLKAAWIEWLGPEVIWEIYGGTESYGGALINGVEWLAHRGSVGRPAARVQIRDEDGRVLPPDEVGAIYFERHPSQAYRPELAEWNSYGDMGSVDEDGYLYIADRRTDMILTGGANLYPAEIESALMEHPAIATAVVVWSSRPRSRRARPRHHRAAARRGGAGYAATTRLSQ